MWYGCCTVHSSMGVFSSDTALLHPPGTDTQVCGERCVGEGDRGCLTQPEMGAACGGGEGVWSDVCGVM